MKQKDIFIESEGDAWLRRNQKGLEQRRLPGDDPVLQELLALSPAVDNGSKVLEVGCGDGRRLEWLANHTGAGCYGVEPSWSALEAATRRGVRAVKGTADCLPFDDSTIDVLVYGFCLYLCDREDLFRVACEGDRVLRSPGWLVVIDFFQSAPVAKPYGHLSGVQTYKMDYRSLFDWHPAYTCYTHKVRHHVNHDYADEPDEWVAVSVLRKSSSK